MGSIEPRRIAGAVKGVSGLLEECEDEREALWAKLEGEVSEASVKDEVTYIDSIQLLEFVIFSAIGKHVDSGRFMIASLSTVNRLPRRSSWRRVKIWG
jgi:hypothetical protein